MLKEELLLRRFIYENSEVRVGDVAHLILRRLSKTRISAYNDAAEVADKLGRPSLAIEIRRKGVVRL